nr:MAG TPA: hypothetical protein [Caudoviricetes sp.]
MPLPKALAKEKDKEHEFEMRELRDTIDELKDKLQVALGDDQLLTEF